MFQNAVILSVLTILASFSAAVRAQDENAVKQELASLQGTWKWISAERQGGEIKSQEYIRQYTLVISGDTITGLGDGTVMYKAKLEIDPSKTPKQVTFHFVSGELEGKKEPLIYSLVGNVLILCGPGPGVANRPTEFSAEKEKGGVYLDVLRREKSGALADDGDNKTASISGQWMGNHIATDGTASEFPLELSVADGKLTGVWNKGASIESGLRVGDALAWSMRAGNSFYLVHGKIQDGGKSLSLDFTFIEERAGQLQKYTGAAVMKKQ
jgi:uncharacterized protein (TIGR03067 family)